LFWRQRLPRTLTAATDIVGYKLVINVTLSRYYLETSIC
jgi:hypothetical protein